MRTEKLNEHKNNNVYVSTRSYSRLDFVINNEILNRQSVETALHIMLNKGTMNVW